MYYHNKNQLFVVVNTIKHRSKYDMYLYLSKVYWGSEDCDNLFHQNTSISSSENRITWRELDSLHIWLNTMVYRDMQI